MVGVAMACNPAEAQSRGKDARSLHDTHVNEIANRDAVASDLDNGGKAMGQGIICLLDGTRLLLGNGFDDPVVVVVGQISREVQVGVDQARHDGPSRDVTQLEALGNLGAPTGIGQLVVLDQNEAVVDGSGTSTINELATCKRVLAHIETSTYLHRMAPVPCGDSRRNRPVKTRPSGPVRNGSRPRTQSAALMAKAGSREPA